MLIRTAAFTILAAFSSDSLFPLATVSHRFRNIIFRIICKRLLFAASLTNATLIVKPYHPSSRNTEPYLFCDYLGTPGLSSAKPGGQRAYKGNNSVDYLGGSVSFTHISGPFNQKPSIEFSILKALATLPTIKAQAPSSQTKRMCLAVNMKHWYLIY